MINISLFKNFIIERFPANSILMTTLREDLLFAEIDCFSEESYKLTVEISIEEIKVSTVNKPPAADFSLYEYIFREEEKAKQFILSIITAGELKFS
jgi:hypothetical protein